MKVVTYNTCLTESFHGTPIRALRGSGPVNSSRWRGASRRPNGTGVNECPVSGAAPANRSFKLTYAGYSRTRRAPDSLAP